MVDEFRSHMTASATPQQPEVPIDGKVSTLGKTAIPNDIAMSQQVAEVADSKQEWEICDIISKEDVDGVVHYLVQWEATLVPKYELGKCSEPFIIIAIDQWFELSANALAALPS
jgi:hypothetical protein